LDQHTALVSIAAANGEIGTVEDLAPLVEATHRHGGLFHTDATQAIGTQQLDVSVLGVDLVSISAHKIYGPQGTGALIARSSVRTELKPIIHGGGQERGQRSGTTNVAGAVGFGAAAELLLKDRESTTIRISGLRDQFLRSLEVELDARLNGPIDRRLPGNLNVRIPGVEADALIASCRGVDFSAGSACSSGVPGPSPVLLAIGLDDEAAQQSVRFGLGRSTTSDDLRRAIDEIVRVARRLRTVNDVPMPA
jgi:cysteine desulfurase